MSAPWLNVRSAVSLILLVLMSAIPAAAQDAPLPLTLEDAVRRAIDNNDLEIAAWLITSLADLGAASVQDLINEAFEKDVVETFVIDRDLVDVQVVSFAFSSRTAMRIRCSPSGRTARCRGPRATSRGSQRRPRAPAHRRPGRS